MDRRLEIDKPLHTPAPTEDTFVSITLIRAIAIAAVVTENYLTGLPWHEIDSVSDALAENIAEISGTFVQVFFVLSGYGLTLSYFKAPPASWAAWAHKRARRIIVPYWVAVIATFAVAKLSFHWSSAAVHADYSWATLLTYLTFTRNFFSPGWALNSTMWFMPAIIGLYAIFPLLVLVLKRYGEAGLLVSALLVTNGAIMLCVFLGYPLSHQGTLPFFFVDEFALGMVLGSIAFTRPELIRQLMQPRYFFLGLAFYALSAAIVKLNLAGQGSTAYNDLFTAIGLYLMMLYVCRWGSTHLPPGLLELMKGMSRSSYIMYLIHGPIIYFVLKPYFGAMFRARVDALPMVMSACAFVLALFAVAQCITVMMQGRARKALAPSSA